MTTTDTSTDTSAGTVVIDGAELAIADVLAEWHKLCEGEHGKSLDHAVWTARIKALCGPTAVYAVQTSEPQMQAAGPQPIVVCLLHERGTTSRVEATYDTAEIAAAAEIVLRSLRQRGEAIAAAIQAHPMRELPPDLTELSQPASAA